MVSRDLFNRMSILALILLVLFGSLAFRSSAYQSDPEQVEEESFNETYEMPSVLYFDSGVEITFTKDDAAAIRKELAAIRQNSDILIYFVVPVSFAVLGICKFLFWFYRTFVHSAI